ncbi:response regulator transcription factor [Corticicoccus populi]|uniref:Response regulator ArlR n=1 Tax=Corticicoccus populi TaxID=1812821 RepID=A0ABW5WVG9_9STAP
MKQVLVIKNEQSSSKKIVSGLAREEGFTVTLHDESQGLDIVLEKNWDIIVLDWDSLSMSGPEICAWIREVKMTPIIIVTNQISSEDCIAALRAGADDYVRKPFEKKELVERIKVILRRSVRVNDSEAVLLKFNDILVDTSRNVVTKAGKDVSLTRREYDLLLFLVKNKNGILSREMLLNQVWGYDMAVNPNVVDLYISYLRKKIGCSKQSRYISTVHGRGYTMSER